MVERRSRMAGIALLVLAQGLAGCGGAGSPVAPPRAPSPVGQPATPVRFFDPASAFSTLDVRDVDEQIVHFNTADELIWTADGRRFQGYQVNGHFVRWDKYYQVRFATRDGDRRAYFCGHGHDDVTDPPSLCDIEVVNGRLVITELNVLCPGL